MPRNVEIKAVSRDWEAQRDTAAVLASSSEEILQEDTFFPCASGRLKLRRVDGAQPGTTLIFYRRDDMPGPKASEYVLCDLGDAAEHLRDVLTQALGTAQTVRKQRTVFHCGQTRIHFDEVEGLGRFIELEVVLRPGQAQEEGEAVAMHLIHALGIREEDLRVGAYADLLTHLLARP